MNHTDLSQSTFDNKPKFKLGVVVNPFAGIGGALALKGSDGAEIREKALAMGAEKKANEKMAKAQIDLVRNLENSASKIAALDRERDQLLGSLTTVSKVHVPLAGR